jgi:hypothetical protein
MSVKLILLQSGESIVSEIKEGYFQDKLVCYILENPCIVFVNGTYKILDEEDDGNLDGKKVSVSLRRWPSMLSLAKEQMTTIELSPNSIVTVLDPIDSLKKMYETQVLGIKEDESNQSVSINEQSNSDQSD